MPATPYRLELGPAARSGSSRSRSGPCEAARSRSAAARTGASCRPRSCGEPCGRSPTRTPTLCCTSTRTSSTRSRCGWRCRRARLRGSGCSRPGRASSAIRAGGGSWIEFVQLPGSTSSRATRRHMEKSSNATELVRDHFREKASSFDALYDEEHPLQRAVRPGLLKRRDFALDVVREYEEPRVLDIGGGSGRVGELVLEAGARRIGQRGHRAGDARSLEGAAGALRGQGQARPRRRPDGAARREVRRRPRARLLRLPVRRASLRAPNGRVDLGLRGGELPALELAERARSGSSATR